MIDYLLDNSLSRCLLLLFVPLQPCFLVIRRPDDFLEYRILPLVSQSSSFLFRHPSVPIPLPLRFFPLVQFPTSSFDALQSLFHLLFVFSLSPVPFLLRRLQFLSHFLFVSPLVQLSSSFDALLSLSHLLFSFTPISFPPLAVFSSPLFPSYSFTLSVSPSSFLFCP